MKVSSTSKQVNFKARMRNGRAVDVVQRPLSAAGKNYQFQEEWSGVEAEQR